MKKKSVLLIGLGRFGKNIAVKLNKLGHDVMAVDHNEDRVNETAPYVTNAIIGNSTDEAFLKSLGIGNYDVCIIAISGDFQSSLETTWLLKQLGSKLVISRAERDGQAQLLLRNGADEIVYPEKELADWIAIRYTADHVLDYIDLGEYSILEVAVPDNWIGKTIIELDVRRKFGINIIAIKENGKVNASVSPDTVLSDKITLLVLGEYSSLSKCFKI